MARGGAIRTGVAKLVTFYTKDQVAQKTAMAELEQLDQALASLAAHQATVAQQLLALDSTDTAGYAEQQQEEVEQQQQQQGDEEAEQQEAGAQAAAKSPRAAVPGGQPAKAKVLYTFQAQSEGEINVFSGTIVNLAEPAPNGDWCALHLFNAACGARETHAFLGFHQVVDRVWWPVWLCAAVLPQPTVLSETLQLKILLRSGPPEHPPCAGH
jgi:hypothetical protein